MMARGDVDSLYPAALSPQTSADILIRHAYGGDRRAIDYSSRYGLLRDDSRLVAHIEGPAPRASTSAFDIPTRSTYRVGVGTRGGGTPSDPGGHNWETLQSGLHTIGQAVATAANFAMDRMSDSDPDTSFRFNNTPIYQKYRGRQRALARQEQQQEQQQRAQEARNEQQQRAQKQQQLANFVSQTFATSMGLAAGVQAGNKPPKAGASSPMPRGGTPPPGPINLLTGPAALGQPPKKPRSARSTVPKPKSTRPTAASALNDPSNW